MGVPAGAQPCVVPVMVGTAGHVDHGKTALVKLLTGCDTDTLPEEKERGLSIDLGFAPFLLQDGRMVGVIDVPGHEDFIRNMVAGASSIDVLILVIAADDGIMPQTIEHLKIVSLLRTPQVMAVITKIDLVSVERQQEIKEAVQRFLAEYGFVAAPIILESNKTGEGISQVRLAIEQLVECVKRPDFERAFRMDIERVFSIQGYGTVVTGIPSAGRCAIDDALELFPGPQPTDCRAIQKYNRVSTDTQASVCSAINLRALKASDIARGMTLAARGVYRQVSSAVLSVNNVHESVTIKRRQEMRFCCGTSTRIVSGLLIGADHLGPGEQGFMRIKFSAPMVLAAGDRFIVRSLSPSATIAGGAVLTVNTDSRRKKQYRTTEPLAQARVAAWEGDTFLSELRAGSSIIITHSDLPFLAQCAETHARKMVDEKVACGILLPLGVGHWLIRSRVAELAERLTEALRAYHKENIYSRGMPSGQVCALLGLDNSCWDEVKKIVSGSGDGIVVHVDCLSLKNAGPALSARQQGLREKIIARVVSAGKSAVAQATLAAELAASDADIRLLIRLLSEEGRITVLGDHLIQTAVVEECLQKLRVLFETREIVELGQFRAATGLSRNTAVPLLELFDSRGITCRTGNGRRERHATIKAGKGI